MIRKTVIAVLLATLLAVAGWAQVDIDGDFTIQSVQAYTSFGLFMNALDGAANVDEQGMGPGFSELENKYIFGGLANMNPHGTTPLQQRHGRPRCCSAI